MMRALDNKISFSWDLHYACNYRCPYCWWDGKWQELAKLNRYLSVEQWMKYWGNIYSRYGSVVIEILGGEPFIYPNFIELMKQLANMHNIRITTNLSTNIADFISQIDPSKVKIFPTFHPLFAEFDSFVKKVLLLKENGFTGDGILYLAYPPQIRQIPYYEEKFDQKGLSLSVMTFWGEYKGIAYPDGYTKEERQTIAAHLGKRADEEFQLVPKRIPKDRLCRAGQSYAVIQADGNVIRCGGSALNERIGTFFEDNFRLLERPMPCKAEYCKCNEWAFLLVEDGKEEDAYKIGGYKEADREIIKVSQDNDKPVYLKNKELNAIEVAERKITLESKPMMLSIIVTNQCNLNCIMCSTPRKNAKDVLLKSAVEKISDLLPYVLRINWQGGEIFYVDYLKELFRSLVSYQHITHEITTNGILLDAEWLEILIHLRLNLLFSIDSVSQETYEYIRRGARFNELIKRLELLKEVEGKFNKEIEKTITAVVMKSNYQELALFIDFAKQYGFHKVIFVPVVFFDNKENIFLNMTPEIKYSLKTTLERVKERALAQGVGVLSTIADFEFGLPCAYKKGTNNNTTEPLDLSKQGLFCVYPWKTLWIDACRGGNIYPDCWCQQNIGNIYSTSLLEAWNNETMKTYRRNLVAADKRLCKLCVDNNRVMP